MTRSHSPFGFSTLDVRDLFMASQGDVTDWSIATALPVSAVIAAFQLASGGGLHHGEKQNPTMSLAM